MLLVGMVKLIEPDLVNITPPATRSHLEFIRLKQEPRIEEKRREPPKPKPDKPEPPPPQPLATQHTRPTSKTPIELPQLNLPVQLNRQSGLAGLLQGNEGDLLPLVRIEPVYPQLALSRGIEGRVKARILIKTDGSVESVEILEADPPRLFDRAVIRAVQRWKFAPRVVDGQTRSDFAIQEFQFRLGGAP
jgi:protein TonB